LLKLSPPRPEMRVKHDFHFQTMPAIAGYGLIAGFVGFFLHHWLIHIGWVMALTALGCFIRPRRIGWRRLSVPVGRLDALVWLQVARIFLLEGLAMQHGLPPDAYLRNNHASHAAPKAESVAPPDITNS